MTERKPKAGDKVRVLEAARDTGSSEDYIGQIVTLSGTDESGLLVWFKNQDDYEIPMLREEWEFADEAADRAARAERIRAALLAYATERSGAPMLAKHIAAERLAGWKDDDLLEIARVIAAA